ncbi:MAG TPA: PEP-CTERM sorting domain-containing protein [Phycisphaerae bacterium]|nr:PEP-CTERM sorting domain-containing protein [Phycisphaerae bacterium]
MVRSYVGGFCALGLVAFAASVASAAAITDYADYDFDPTKQDFELWLTHSPAAYLTTWDTSGGNLAPADHSPGGPPSYGPPGGNPAWLKFNSTGNGGGGGGGTAGDTLSTFILGNEYGNDWSMDFYVMIFDAEFAGEKINVYLAGEDPTDPNNIQSASVEKDAVKTGKLLMWKIDAAAGEEVTVYIESIGDESYAAGFLMDNADVGPAPTIPEPATLALLGLGAAGLVARRRRRR